MERHQAASNHKQAPGSASFVQSMRSSFGDKIKVLYVRENGLELGNVPDMSGNWINGRDMVSLDIERKGKKK